MEVYGNSLLLVIKPSSAAQALSSQIKKKVIKKLSKLYKK